MKAKKRIFFSIILVIAIISSFQIIANAESSINPRVSYTYCKLNSYNFVSSYDTNFGCGQADTTISLKSTNHAITRGAGVPSSNTYKEAYVGLQNSSGTWKSDTRSNSNIATVGAEVNPLVFTPVYSLHELLYYETDGYKMHSRSYR